MGERWQELNAGRASARLGTARGMQLKGSAQCTEPLRPWEVLRAAFPFKLSLPTLACWCVSWLDNGSLSTQLKQPSLLAGGFHVSSSSNGSVTRAPVLLDVARNWGLFSPWGDSSQHSHELQGLAFPFMDPESAFWG